MAVDRQKLFGTDICLRDAAGGMDFTLGGPIGSSGDLTLASGNDNAVQALSLRLRVRKGELAPLGWPDYGSGPNEPLGEPAPPWTRIQGQGFPRQALEAAPVPEHVGA